MLLESDVRRIIAVSLPVFFATLLAGCDRETVPQEQAQPESKTPITQRSLNMPVSFGLESASGMAATLSYSRKGTPAPKMVFTGADGREVSLGDYAGRPLLVNLWATWCAPCKAEMPTLDSLAELEEGRVSVIAVSQDLNGRKPVRQFFESAQIVNLEPFTDPNNRLLAAIGGNPALPVTILYNSEGREVWRVTGGVEWDDAEIAKLIAEAG
jgi:thiol-disulfide isomerase/thioredoxin